MAYQSINPNTGKLVKSFEHLTHPQLETKLAAADSCFQAWKNTSYAERAAILNKAAALMHAHVDDFAKLATLEMGKRIDEARGEVKFSGDILAYYAENAEAFLAPMALHPKLGEAHNNLAVIYMQTGRLATAEEEIRAAEKAGFRVSSQFKDDLKRLRTEN